MTKLKTPIVGFTYDTVELVVGMLLLGDAFSEARTPQQSQMRDSAANENQRRRAAMIEALLAQGIDYRTWEPPQPIRVNNYEVTANPDGSVTVGCTTVSRPTLEAIVKLSSEAMGEWPKFTKSHDGHILEFHQDHSKSIWHSSNGIKMPIRIYDDYAAAIRNGHKPLTPQQAAEILEGRR